MFCCSNEYTLTRETYYRSLGEDSSCIGGVILNIHRIVRGYNPPSKWTAKEKIKFLESAAKTISILKNVLLASGIILGLTGLVVCFSLGGSLAPGLRGQVALSAAL